jgi:hypothetical protein
MSLTNVNRDDLQPLPNAAEVLQILNSELSCCASLESMLSHQLELLQRSSAEKYGTRQLVCREYVCSLEYVTNARELEVIQTPTLQGLHADLDAFRGSRAQFLQPVLLPLLTKVGRFMCFVEDDHRLERKIAMGFSTAVFLGFVNALLCKLDRGIQKDAMIVTNDFRDTSSLRKLASRLLPARIQLIDLFGSALPTRDDRPHLIICSPDHFHVLDTSHVALLAWDCPADSVSRISCPNLEGLIVRGHSRDRSGIDYPFVKDAATFTLSSTQRLLRFKKVVDPAAVLDMAKSLLSGVRPETVMVMAPNPAHFYCGGITSVGFDEQVPSHVSCVLVLEPDEASARRLLLSCPVEIITFVTSQVGVCRAMATALSEEALPVPDELSVALQDTHGSGGIFGTARTLI